MAGLFAVKVSPSPRDRSEPLAESFRRQGFDRIELIDAGSWRLGFARRAGGDDSYAAFRGDRGSIYCIGTLLYRARFGARALPRMLEDFLDGRVRWDEVWGSFAAIVVAEDRVVIFTDPTGTFHLYADAERSTVSSSFLALAESLPRLTINPDAVYDYVFQGSPHGHGTIFDEIRLLDRDGHFDLTDSAVFRPRESRPLAPMSTQSVDDLARDCLDRLRPFFAALRDELGDNVDTALSGGYDSRLILALLREQGVSARLHVYGGKTDSDVQVAKNVALGEGLDLDHVDKQSWPKPSPDSYPAIVEANYLAFDGYPNDGIFENGADLATREQRAESGRVTLNGGGGEVFRNFFYLADREYSARQVAQSFYCQFDPAMWVKRSDAREYVANFGRKIAEAVGAGDGRKLARQQVEAAYPYFRCRFWMGRNNSVNNRLGFAVTPFIQDAVVRTALTIPLRYKNAGRLQSRMLQMADPRLASYASGYGHAFDGPPSQVYRFKDLAGRSRPPWLRAVSYRMKHRGAPELPWPLSPAYLGKVIEGEFEYLPRFFRLEAVGDPGQLNRIATLEYLFRRLNPS